MTDFHGYDDFVVAQDEEIPNELPESIRLTESGRLITINFDDMKLNGDTGPVSIRLRDKGQFLSQATAEIFYFVMLNALNSKLKLSTVSRWMSEFKLFTKTVNYQINKPISTITLKMFIWYTSKKNASQQKLLRSTLKFWVSQSVPGISYDLRHYLSTSKAPTPRSTIEIQNLVSKERPFTIEQIRNILSTIEGLYLKNIFNPQDYLMWRLIVSEAMRPSQMQLLQYGDIKYKTDKNGNITSVNLKVPLVKQSGTPARKYMIDCQLSEPVGRAMIEHLKFITDLLGHTPHSSLSLFSVFQRCNKEAYINNKSLNISANIIKNRKLISGNNVELDDIDLFTRRFKHTKLTHLAMLGAPLEVLARAGYHTSTTSLLYYVNLTEEAFVEYENLLSQHYDKIANTFSGNIIHKDHATHTDSNHAILDQEMNESVGSCASNLCGVFAPFGCYLCIRFEAFIDAPHELVLDFLVKKKERAIHMDLPVDAIGRDEHIITAIKEVITTIKKGKYSAQ